MGGGVVPTVHEAMRVHAEEVECLVESTKLLLMLTQDDPEASEICLGADGLALVLDTMRRYEEEPRILENLIGVLSNLSDAPCGWRAVLDDGGGMTAIVGAMHTGSTYVGLNELSYKWLKVHQEAVRALKHFFYKGPIRRKRI